jgi:hypothetical protein
LPQKTSIDPSVLHARINRLTEGYNKNVVQITAQILSEKQAVGGTFSGLERQPHIDTANRLLTLLDNGHKIKHSGFECNSFFDYESSLD